MKGQADPRFLPFAHLTDEQLLAFLDGEMPASETEMAKTHIAICNECGIRMASFEECSESFLALRKMSLPDDPPLRELPVSQFRERLARHAESRSKKSSFDRSWRRLFVGGMKALAHRRKPVLAIAVAIALVIATTISLLDSTASAETVLLKAEEYESHRKPDSGYLAREVLQVEKIDEKEGTSERVGTIVLIHDSTSPAIYMRSDFAAGRSEEGAASSDYEMGSLARRAFGSANVLDSSVLLYLEKQHSFPNVSVSEFRKLIAGRGNRESSTKREGTALEVHYPFAPGHPSGIREAVLFVNRDNYSPDRVSLFTGTQDAGLEYRFTRTSFSVKDRTPQLAQLFHTPEADVPPAGTRSRVVGSIPTPLAYADSHAIDAEVAAAQALHEASACLGEEIYVFPMSDGSIQVQGLVDSKERRDAIKQALTRWAVPVRADIYTPEELKSGALLFAPPYAPDGARGAANKPALIQVADLSLAQMAYHDELYNYYVNAGKNPEEAEKEVTAFSNELSSLARWTLLNAWSIKKLEQEFSPARTTALSSHELQTIARMRDDHIQQIRNAAQKQADMLAPLLSNSGGLSSGGPLGWHDSETLLHLAEEQDHLILSLFATSQQSAEKDAALSRLADVLRRLSQ
jgi:hypothetical protein